MELSSIPSPKRYTPSSCAFSMAARGFATFQCVDCRYGPVAAGGRRPPGEVQGRYQRSYRVGGRSGCAFALQG